MTEFEDYSCFGSTRSTLQPSMCELSWMPTTESILSSRLQSMPPCRLRPPVLSDHICLAHWVVVIYRFYCSMGNQGVAGSISERRRSSCGLLWGFRKRITKWMAECKTAVSPVHYQWRYCSLALNHGFLTTLHCIWASQRLPHSQNKIFCTSRSVPKKQPIKN